MSLPRQCATDSKQKSLIYLIKLLFVCLLVCLRFAMIKLSLAPQLRPINMFNQINTTINRGGIIIIIIIINHAYKAPSIKIPKR